MHISGGKCITFVHQSSLIFYLLIVTYLLTYPQQRPVIHLLIFRLVMGPSRVPDTRVTDLLLVTRVTE